MLTPSDKRYVLRKYAEKFSLRVFVETGTYDGETVMAMLAEPCLFDIIYTIEMSAPLFSRAALKIYDYPLVWMVFGNSGILLQGILSRIQEPALIWLDAHPGEPGTAGTYGETPLRNELQAIFQQPKGHVVLIDDARLMGEEGWPTLDEVRLIVRSADYDFSISDDIVRCVPCAKL